MGRQVHLVEVSNQQLKAFHKARLVAAAVLIVFFTGFIVFSPEIEPQVDRSAVAAAPDAME